MIKKATFTLLAVMALAAGADAQMLTISEVYGGGGNSGSTYKNDFIEVYNYGTTTVDVSTLSVYYGSATGTTFNTSNSTPLTGTIAAKSFYLIQEAAGTAGTTALPTPNATGTINISSTAGRVALGLTSTLPTSATSTGVVDFLGWGGASQYEGTGPATATTNTTSINRQDPTVDSNDNSKDFVLGSPSPGAAYLAPPAAVPEPATYVSMLGGLGAMVLAARRRVA